mmetsp:Transcript_4006/g.10545  ORF Transcript_4006/g.10545 Transcript_4006/m.10545 type:complete len:225 (-) Transcript_4006:684-1358(-)
MSSRCLHSTSLISVYVLRPVGSNCSRPLPRSPSAPSSVGWPSSSSSPRPSSRSHSPSHRAKSTSKARRVTCSLAQWERASHVRMRGAKAEASTWKGGGCGAPVAPVASRGSEAVRASSACSSSLGASIAPNSKVTPPPSSNGPLALSRGHSHARRCEVEPSSVCFGRGACIDACCASLDTSAFPGHTATAAEGVPSPREARPVGGLTSAGSGAGSRQLRFDEAW